MVEEHFEIQLVPSLNQSPEKPSILETTLRLTKDSETQTNQAEMKRIREALNIGKIIGQSDSDEYSEESLSMPEGNTVQQKLQNIYQRSEGNALSNEAGSRLHELGG